MYQVCNKPILLHLVVYLSSYHEKAIKALLPARLGVAGRLSHTSNGKLR